MVSKRALIVDDSKSARVILSRMLEKYEIEVDMSESAEAAIDYLKHHRPDAIFMDHLMPGMDGLQAVQAIKGNPHTATIPIMMYTSQEGELYVGQARALGAMGVLPKQVRPVDVSKVLYELHLLPDRRDSSVPALRPVEVSASASPAAAEATKAPSEEPSEWGRRLEASVRDQSAELRRFLVASLDAFAARISSDMREWTTPAPADPVPVAPAPKSAESGKLLAGGLAVALITAVIFALLWSNERGEAREMNVRLVALTTANADLRRGQQELTESVKELSNALAVPGTPSANTAGESMQGEAESNAALARSELVPYGEAALDRSRVEVLRELLGRLEAQGFRGTVKVAAYAGSFCLAGNGADGYVLAPPATALNKCDIIGNPYEESLGSAERESVSLANLIKGTRQRSAGGISVSIENGGATRNAAPYPQRSETTLAGDWNKAAAANNRVEYSIEPSAS